MLVQHCAVIFSRKLVKIYHYVITNKSEKTIELLLEHPKEWSRPVGSVSLIVEECYHGTDKVNNKIDVKTEYHLLLFFIIISFSVAFVYLSSLLQKHF